MSRRRGLRRRKNRKWIPAAISACIALAVIGAVGVVYLVPDNAADTEAASVDPSPANEIVKGGAGRSDQSRAGRGRVNERLLNVLVSDEQMALQEPEIESSVR